MNGSRPANTVILNILTKRDKRAVQFNLNEAKEKEAEALNKREVWCMKRHYMFITYGNIMGTTIIIAFNNCEKSS